MLTIRINPASPQQVRWPKTSAEILALGQAVHAAEQNLPANQQYPQFALLESRLDALQTVITSAYKAEARRTAQSGAEKTAFKTARALTRRLITILTGRYVDVTLLEDWGIEVVGTGPRARTRVPQTKSEILTMLNRYLAQETSLPADQRITAPSLAEVTAAYEALANANSQRVEALSIRELAIRQRDEAAQVLLQALKHLALYHVTYHFGGVVDQNLQTLGFDLVTRTPERPSPPVNAPETGGNPVS